LGCSLALNDGDARHRGLCVARAYPHHRGVAAVGELGLALVGVAGPVAAVFQAGAFVVAVDLRLGATAVQADAGRLGTVVVVAADWGALLEDAAAAQA